MTTPDSETRIAELEHKVASLSQALTQTNTMLDYIARTLNLVPDNSPSTPDISKSTAVRNVLKQGQVQYCTTTLLSCNTQQQPALLAIFSRKHSMTSNIKPRGYFEKLLFIDCETSGLAFNSVDPSYDEATGKTYQAVSWGMVVTDAQTLKAIERLYVEIKWDGKSEWSVDAQRVHGLSLEYLEEHGMTDEEAVVAIAELILKYWGPDGVVCVGGHNVATFDLPFLRRLLTDNGIHVKFGSRVVDTNSLGFGTFGTFISDDLFDTVGIPERGEHNALADADAARIAVQRVRKMFTQCLNAE